MSSTTASATDLKRPNPDSIQSVPTVSSPPPPPPPPQDDAAPLSHQPAAKRQAVAVDTPYDAAAPCDDPISDEDEGQPMTTVTVKTATSSRSGGNTSGTVIVCKDESTIIYSNVYSKYIPLTKNIVASELIKSRDGGGFMAFLTMSMSDGAMPVPIRIQTPPLVTPSGAVTFKDGKSSMVLSLGQSDDEWMNCPQKAAFVSLINSIDENACRIIATKGWARVGPVSEEDSKSIEKVKGFFTPTLDKKDNKKDPTKKYSLSMHLSISTGPVQGTDSAASVSAQKQKTTRFYAVDSDNSIREICMVDIEKLSVVSVLCEIAWVYRRTPTKFPAFSLRLNALEVVLRSSPSTQSGMSGCHIDPTL